MPVSWPAILPGEPRRWVGETDAAVWRTGVAGGLLADARRNLERISGEADAARAEGRRQEALAAMAAVAERLRVATAERLLRWAIERYREARQGPMLERAGGLFSSLTLGGFSRLVVDMRYTPPSLNGLRMTTAWCHRRHERWHPRPALSALSLAALELHLDRPGDALHRRRPGHQLRRRALAGRAGRAGRTVAPHTR